MGGKHKQSQRTKNNVRPSSSGRSAELLNSASKFDPTMTKFSGKLMPALFPTLAAVTLDAGLDPELAMCIKKLNKKDPVTKTKALQELTELVNKSSVESVEAALPGWCHFYKALSVDADCKVRECTQVCHGAIVRVCGRRVAPHLKQLLPSWLQAQYDDHAPAHSQAQLSLKNTFPDAKLPEVIAFCKTEIFDFLEDNLTGKSALAAAATEDEGGRTNAAALHGLAWSCRHAPKALDDWLWQRVKQLLNTDAFWRLATHKEFVVRGAWFAALGSIVERFSESLDAKLGTRLLRVLLQARETEPRAHAQLWGCLLLCMHSAKEWKTWLDKKDLLAKRILNLLETGGWGDARQLSKTLLPLLAGLPEDMLTHHFYEEFFKAIIKGLERKSLLSCALERRAWVRALAECVRFLSLQPPPAADLCSAAHRRWLLAVTAPQLDGVLKYSAECMADLLKFWMRKSSEEGGDRYPTLVRNFWQNIGATISAQSDNLSADEAAASAQRHERLLSAIQASALQTQGRQHSIRFDDDEPTEVEPTAPSSPLDPANMELFHHHLSTAAEQVCARYIEIANKTKSPNVILPAISPLLNSLSRSSIEAMARYLDAATTYGLFEKVLLPWLQDADTRCEAVMDVVFLLLAHMTDEEQDAMFANFTEESVCRWSLQRSLSHAHVSRAGVRRWLQGEPVHRVLAAAARELQPADTKLLLMALTPDYHDEMLVSAETVSSVVEVLVTSLSPQPSEHQISVLSQLATTLAQRPPDNYRTLLLAVFNAHLAIQRGSPQLSLESWLEARSSWQDGLLALDTRPRALLRAEAARLLLAHVLPCCTLEDVNISKIEHATSLCPYLLTECEHRVPSSTEETVQLIRQLFDAARNVLEGSTCLDVFALRHDCIVSKLSCPFADDNDAIAQVVKDCDREDIQELEREDLVVRLTELLFRALSLRTLFLHRPDDDDASEDKEQTWCCVLLREDHIREEFCQLLRDYVVVHSLHDGYAFWPHYDIIERVKSKLDVALQDMVSETPPSLRGHILRSLSERAAKQGYYWAYATSWYDAQSAERSPDQSPDQSPDARPADRSPDQSPDALDAAGEVDNLAEVITGNGLYHSLQANLRWCPVPPSPSPSASEPPPPSAALRTAHVVMLRSALAALKAERAPSELRERFASEALVAAQAGAEPDVIVDLYYRFENVMVGERDPSSVSWQAVVCSAAVAEYLAQLVGERGWWAAPPTWDLAAIALCAMLAAPTTLATTKSAMLYVSSLRLLRSVRTFVQALPAQCERRQPAAHVAALANEWRDIFSPDIHTNLFNVIMRVLESPPPGPLSCPLARSLSALTWAALHLQWPSLPAHARAGPLSLQLISQRCARALASTTHRGYKYLAHHTLAAIATDLLQEDVEKLSQWSSSSAPGPPPALSPAYVRPHYGALLDLLDAAVAGIPVGESTCEMCPGSDSRSVALGALLLTDVIHAVCAPARGDLMQHYIQIFREEKYTDLLLASAFRLLPSEVFSFAMEHQGAQALDPKYVELFVTQCRLSIDEPEAGSCGVSGDVCALSCRALYHSLSGPGQAGARGAALTWPAAAARALARLTAAAVTPRIVADQFRYASAHAHTLADTELMLLPAVREAVVVHTIENRPHRLTISFAADHPLSPARVEAPAAGPAAGAQWLAAFLSLRLGDVLAAAALWTAAADARVERSPRCCVCYCRLQPREGTLPRAACRQCRNHFHRACLRQWFLSSSKTNCPVCRGKF